MPRIKLAPDFKDFLNLCHSHEVRYMIIGGYAVVHYSRPRYTGALDLWVDASLENAGRVVAALHDFGLTGPDVTTDMITSQRQIIRMGFEPMRLELFTRIPGLEFSDCYPRRTESRIGSLTIPFLSLEDLKTNKRATGRPKDSSRPRRVTMIFFHRRQQRVITGELFKQPVISSHTNPLRFSILFYSSLKKLGVLRVLAVRPNVEF